MPKTKISEFSATPGNNTDIDGINIAEGCAPSGINDAIRELMAQLKDFQAGTAGDSFNGPVGTTTAAAGAFTTLSASSTVSGTGFSTYLASPPAIGGTAAAAGSFTTLSASSSVTLSGGTANGVAYLNGSKVLTSGSALTFDGTTFANSISGGVGFRATASSGTSSIRQQFVNTGGTFSIGLDASNGAIFGAAYAGVMWHDGNYPLLFGVNNAEQMRLTSTGLGIGTSSPGAKLDVSASVSGGIGGQIYLTNSAATAAGNTNEIAFRNSSGFTGTYKSARIVSGLNTASNGDTYLSFWTYADPTNPGGLERARITSGGNLLVGTTSDVAGKIQIAVAANGIGLRVQSTSDSTIAADIVPSSLSAIFGDKGSINTFIANTASSILQFVTGSAERARITSGGNLLVGTTTNNASGGVIQVSNGITFPATQSASSDANTLDDYEEGTWTPVLRDSAANQATMTLQQGFYTKIGNVVYAWCQVAYSSKTAMTGTWYAVAGLPFAAKTNTGNYYYGGVVQSDTSTSDVISLIAGGDSLFVFSASNSYTLQQVSALSASGRIIVTATYVV